MAKESGTKVLQERLREAREETRKALGGERAMARWLTAALDDNAQLRHAIHDFVEIQDEYLALHRSTKTKVPREWSDAYRALRGKVAAPSYGGKESNDG